ncbi:MAG: asparagine synthase (glutamine-hydrolyzing) [Labilithrix sp.]|nr:asparagine synthase (glutamine-hydrolyzing) [Labilithrix sp.]
MCGIVGLVAFDAPLPRARALVEEMAERIAHRGPDGGGVAAHEDATIGMKRLAIVDVEHGQQPMTNDEGSVVIVQNGEIYNAPLIRRDLEARGVKFRTRSDTEVILRLYEQNPDDVERHLAGMWAFAIHDRRRRRVILSRDRFGIKPLFVAETTRAIAFASELRAFARSLPPFEKCFAVDHAAAHAMMSWSFVPEASTIYRGVKRLPPATRMTIDLATHARRIEEYWHLVPSADAARISSLDEACAAVEPLLRRAVREHLESDVPIASFLSGGIDSALVTHLAVQESRAPIKAYSIGFHERRFDESPYARQTAQRLGIENQIAMFDEETARDRLPSALLAYDEPFGDSSGLATFLLCEHVAKGYKVALGGDGGDEVFAGYKKYLVVKLRRPFRSTPTLRDGVGRALGRIPTRTDRTRAWTEVLRTLRRLSRGLSGSDAEVYAQLTQVAPLARTAPLMRSPADASTFIDIARSRFERGSGSELQRTLGCDLANTLCNDMLVKVDRASMANRLEARVPFLDHRVVEFGVGLPERYALGVSGKRVLRALHERTFGSRLAKRKKMGFGVPVEKWLRGPLDYACERMFNSQRLDRFGILAPEAFSYGRHRDLARTDPIVLWHAFALAAWCEANLGDGPDSLRELLCASRAASTDGAEPRPPTSALRGAPPGG